MPVEQLEVENLHLWRGERHVLRGLRFALARGACLEVCGANGSGKTTLLRTLCGLIYPEEGRVLWNGAQPISIRGAAALPEYLTALSTRLNHTWRSMDASARTAGRRATDVHA